MSQIQGVGDMSDDNSKLLVDIQIQLARIEKTLEVVPTLAAAVETLREIARNADQSAKSAHHRLDLLQTAKEIADEALRTAQTAIAEQNVQKEDQKWFKRTFYGAVITGFAGVVVAAVWAGIKLAALN
ncbi:hypothetical protein JCM10914A_55650 [Paenibacillus sp. JCM 10914]|uniref:hypothetical protein n=1 Tax=Paenibacillus sp. JCM 10914 TaxID=1236974 RepID=UPI0003CC5ED2|nr:hypothetical protein [Paenibacillus sp. JCM 10914]GAE09632.1 hypothetical protein JCM10914_6003 [Paenibacillus sp. JCM 10914]